jgi:hypothetical protein
MRYLHYIVMACFSLLGATPARAHGTDGSRVFTSTLTIDNPAIADKAAFPAFTWRHAGADEIRIPTNTYNFDFEFDKRITDDFSFGISDGYSLLQKTDAMACGGWRGLPVSPGYPVYRNDERKLLVSLGVIREFARTGSSRTANDDVGSTICFGKGWGNLPIDYFRPLAAAGTLGYRFADKTRRTASPIEPEAGTAAFSLSNPAEDRWDAGLSVRYSFPYPRARVMDFGLPALVSRLRSMAEFAWSSPAQLRSARNIGSPPVLPGETRVTP